MICSSYIVFLYMLKYKILIKNSSCASCIELSIKASLLLLILFTYFENGAPTSEYSCIFSSL